MTACLVCGLIGSAVPMLLASGKQLGPFCPGECSALGWEAHFELATGAPPIERALTTWKWRKRRAEARSLPFVEPIPLMDSEKALLRLDATVGLPVEHLEPVALLMAQAERLKRGVA